MTPGYTSALLRAAWLGREHAPRARPARLAAAPDHCNLEAGGGGGGGGLRRCAAPRGWCASRARGRARGGRRRAHALARACSRGGARLRALTRGCVDAASMRPIVGGHRPRLSARRSAGRAFSAREASLFVATREPRSRLLPAAASRPRCGRCTPRSARWFGTCTHRTSLVARARRDLLGGLGGARSAFRRGSVVPRARATPLAPLRPRARRTWPSSIWRVPAVPLGAYIAAGCRARRGTGSLRGAAVLTHVSSRWSAGQAAGAVGPSSLALRS